jgi:hypothetical protein
MGRPRTSLQLRRRCDRRASTSLPRRAARGRSRPGCAWCSSAGPAGQPSLGGSPTSRRTAPATTGRQPRSSGRRPSRGPCTPTAGGRGSAASASAHAACGCPSSRPSASATAGGHACPCRTRPSRGLCAPTAGGCGSAASASEHAARGCPSSRPSASATAGGHACPCRTRPSRGLCTPTAGGCGSAASASARAARGCPSGRRSASAAAGAQPCSGGPRPPRGPCTPTAGAGILARALVIATRLRVPASCLELETIHRARRTPRRGLSDGDRGDPARDLDNHHRRRTHRVVVVPRSAAIGSAGLGPPPTSRHSMPPFAPPTQLSDLRACGVPLAFGGAGPASPGPRHTPQQPAAARLRAPATVPRDRRT